MTATRPRRWFNLAALASAVLLACTVALWLAGFFLDTRGVPPLGHRFLSRRRPERLGRSNLWAIDILQH